MNDDEPMNHFVPTFNTELSECVEVFWIDHQLHRNAVSNNDKVDFMLLKKTRRT